MRPHFWLPHSPESAQASKRHDTGFVLTEAELRRIVAVVEQQLDQFPEKHKESGFTIRYRNGTVVNWDNLDQVLAEENHGSRQIACLEMNASAYRLDHCDPDNSELHRVYLRFTDPESDSLEDSSIGYTVTGCSREWVFVTSSLLDDRIQKVKKHRIERILTDHKSPLFPAFFMLILVLSIATSAIYFRVDESGSTVERAISTIEQQRRAGQVIDPVDALLTVERSRIEQDRFGSRTVKQVVYPICFVMILALCLAIYRYCSPQFNFAWGDYLDHYGRRHKIRSMLFGAVILAVLVGLLTDVISRAVGL